MFNITRSALFFGLLAIASRISDAVSANCTLQTAALAENPNINLQAAAVNQDIANQVKLCIEQQNDDCDVNPDYSPYTTACEAEGGVVYQPELTYQCKNDGYTTTITQVYITCVGSSCDTDEFSDVVNDQVQNITTAVGAVLNVDGIECSAKFSSGANKVFGFVVSMVTVVVSMIMIASF